MNRGILGIVLGILSLVVVIVSVVILLDYIVHETPKHLAPSPTTHITVTPKNGGIYPDMTMTPGDVFDVTKEQICRPGYTKEVRNVSIQTKRQVYEEYGVSYPQPRGAYEVDHFIPLELGGSNDIKNLFLEAASPAPGFHEKDIVENYLHDQVCHGKESLVEAQNEIRADWYAVYKRIPNPQNYKW